MALLGSLASVFQHPFMSLRAPTANRVVPMGFVFLKNTPLHPMVTAVDSVTLRTEERGVFQVKRVQRANIAICDCCTNLVEVFRRHDRSKNAGKALTPDLGGRRIAKELNVTGFFVTRGAQEARLSRCNRVAFHDAELLSMLIGIGRR